MLVLRLPEGALLPEPSGVLPPPTTSTLPPRTRSSAAGQPPVPGAEQSRPPPITGSLCKGVRMTQVEGIEVISHPSSVLVRLKA